MKFKLLAIALSALAVAGVAACTSDDETPTTEPTQGTQATATTRPATTATAGVTGTPGTPRPGTATAVVTGTPGTPRPTGTPGTPRPTGTPGTPRPTGTPGTPMPTGTPGTPGPTGTPGTPGPGTPVAPAEDIVAYLTAAGNFTTLIELVQEADLEETLTGEGPFTLFAPTDEAFDALPPAELQALRDDPEALEAALNYLVVDEELMAEDLVDAGFVTTVEGSNISITEQAGTVMLNNEATVTETDIDAGNGVVHVIDVVVLPPTS